MDQQQIHDVVLQDDELNQTEIENEDGETVVYAEIASEAEDEESLQKDGIEQEMVEEEEEEENTLQLRQVPFEKVGRFGNCHCWCAFCFH